MLSSPSFRVDSEAVQPPLALPAHIFRAYDIRGLAGRELTTEVVYALGRAIATEALLQQQNSIVVGRDGRLSGPELIAALIKGLTAGGCDVIDIGCVPTPVLYFATYALATYSGVILTGSHNPADYNGLKIRLAGKTLAEDRILALRDRVLANQFTQGIGQCHQDSTMIARYIAKLYADIKLAKPLKIVVDAGNGVAGLVAPALFKALGCEVIELYCAVDGNFPHHHPDPSDENNLTDLIAAVKQHRADLGLAFDGDADRLGVVTEQGEIIRPDQQLMLYAQAVLAQHPGATVVYDVKCSRHLATLIREHQGHPIMWKTGHALITAKMRESKALLAGEMSGHIFFHDRYYGFDDGIYAAARLLELLAQTPQSASEFFSNFPKSVSTPELKLAVAEDNKFTLLENFIATAQFPDANLITLDGLRVEFPYGWGLIRASNTSPYLVFRFEADTLSALHQIQALFREQLLAFDDNLLLPF